VHFSPFSIFAQALEARGAAPGSGLLQALCYYPGACLLLPYPALLQVHTLQFRFTDGSSFKLDTPGATELQDVFAAIDAHRASLGKGAAPYVLVSPHPKQQFGPAEAGRTLQQLGIQPRTTRAVVPNAAGHRPSPTPPPRVAAAAPAVPAAPSAAEPMEAEHSTAAAEAVAAPKVPEPAGQAPQVPKERGAAEQSQEGSKSSGGAAGSQVCVLEVRLTNGDVLRHRFDGGATTLCEVLDYVDMHRTDGRWGSGILCFAA
jgi:hypothetical protein